MISEMKNDSMYVNGPTPQFPVATNVWAMCEAHELIERTLAGWQLVCAWPNGTALLSMVKDEYVQKFCEVTEPPAEETPA